MSYNLLELSGNSFCHNAGLLAQGSTASRIAIGAAIAIGIVVIVLIMLL